MKFIMQFVFMLVMASYVQAQEQFRVFFDSNKFELSGTEMLRLNNWINTNKEIKIVGIHGFCDEDGSVDFNDTLAKKRIDFVSNCIKGKLKIRDDFKTRNFGEKHQLSKIKAENRKVTLFYLESKDIIREEELLGIKKEKPKTKPEITYPKTLIVNNPNGTKSEFVLDIPFMKKVASAAVGEKLKIKNLNFQLNTFIITPDSRSKLYELLYIMQLNPDLNIEIQGHLCCSSVDKQDLSTQRAKAIYSFLIINDIKKSRLSYKGFGSKDPIFPLPEKSEAERAANRRVEIMIMKN